jgi:endoglucanase
MKLKCIIASIFFVTVANAQLVKNHGQLSVIGTQLVDKNEDKISLRGVSLGWHNWWPRFYNKETVKWLRDDWNANVLRVAMGVDADENSYIKSPDESKAKVQAVVNAAIKQDMYVIIDWHSHNIHLKEANVFFDEMSKKYGQYPNVIYEIFNEPERQSWLEVKAYSEEIIATIRKNDPDNIILVGSPSWDQDVHLAAENPIKGYRNLMYTLHFYAATHDKSLRERADRAIADGLPIFISESAGMEATGDGPLDIKAWQEYVDWMESKNLSWITWSVSDKNESCSFLFPSAASKGNWKEKDLTESGKKTRKYLKALNNK